MDFEIVIYGIIPIVIALFGIIATVYLTSKKFNPFGFIVSFLILTFNSLSIYILVKILLDAWPSYTPHILILLSTVLLIIQYLIFKKKKTFANNVYKK